MSRVEDSEPIRDIKWYEKVVKWCEEPRDDPLAAFCDKHPRYDKLDKFLARYFVFFAVVVVPLLAILTGLAIRWAIF